MDTQTLIFHAEWFGEPAAGLRAGYEKITISFEYGGIVLDADTVDFWRESVKDFYDGAKVFTDAEWQKYSAERSKDYNVTVEWPDDQKIDWES